LIVSSSQNGRFARMGHWWDNWKMVDPEDWPKTLEEGAWPS
jgi:hypothetical protein